MDQFNFDSFPNSNFNETNLDWLLSLVQQLTELVESGRYGVPAGGSAGQVLGKLGPDDFDTGWIDQTGGGGTSNYAQLTNKPRINGVELLGNMTAAELNLVAAQAGMGLSSNDYTNADKVLLSSLFFADRSTTYAELDAAFAAGKKLFFMDAGEIFPCLEKTSTQFRFLTLRSSGGIREAAIGSSGSWSVSTSANPGSFVKYTSMSLSDAQKQQARTNIGAVGTGDYNPDAKTAAMTQAVGKDSSGKLWTAPGGGGGASPIYTYDATDIALNDSAIPINATITPGYYLLSVGVLWGEGGEQNASEYINGKRLGTADTAYLRRASGHYMSYNTWILVDDEKMCIIRRFAKSDYLVTDSAWGNASPEQSAASVALSLKATELTSWGFVAATNQNAAEVHLRLWKL